MRCYSVKDAKLTLEYKEERIILECKTLEEARRLFKKRLLTRASIEIDKLMWLERETNKKALVQFEFGKIEVLE